MVAPVEYPLSWCISVVSLDNFGINSQVTDFDTVKRVLFYKCQHLYKHDDGLSEKYIYAYSLEPVLIQLHATPAMLKMWATYMLWSYSLTLTLKQWSNKRLI